MPEALVTLVIATTLLLGSPGPVPLALAATGAVFGFARGLPFLLGILSGLAVVILLGATGITVLFETFPASRFIVQLAGGLYIAYVALKIATAPVLTDSQSEQKAAPIFRDGFIFNLLNPKAYAAFLALFSKFQLPLENALLSMVATGVVAYLVAIVVDLAWLALGGVLRPVFATPKLARITRIIFGALMIVAVALTFWVS